MSESHPSQTQRLRAHRLRVQSLFWSSEHELPVSAAHRPLPLVAPAQVGIRIGGCAFNEGNQVYAVHRPVRVGLHAYQPQCGGGQVHLDHGP